MRNFSGTTLIPLEKPSAAAFSSMVSASCALGPYPAMQATILPSWRSITDERYALPSAVLISVMSVSRFSLGRSAVKSQAIRFPRERESSRPRGNRTCDVQEHAP